MHSTSNGLDQASQIWGSMHWHLPADVMLAYHGLAGSNDSLLMIGQLPGMHAERPGEEMRRIC
jgi:hypothetical protein